jgi:uncharacterized protein YbjT (DUF2867 family)
MVATRDIGKAAAQALVEGGHGKAVIELAGPRDLSPRDVAEALARVTAKPIALQVGPEDAIVSTLQHVGMNAHWASLFEEMIRGVNSGKVAWEGRGTRAVRGSTSIDEVLKSLVGAR